MMTTGDRDWTEDFSHENGNYQCRCCVCDELFMGHKRRVVCKLCDSRPIDPTSLSLMGIESPTGEYLDRWAALKNVELRRLVRLTPYGLIRRWLGYGPQRHTALTMDPGPWHRWELDAEFRQRIAEKLKGG